MAQIKVWIDKTRCLATQGCVQTAPEAFSIGPDNRSQVDQDAVSDEAIAAPTPTTGTLTVRSRPECELTIDGESVEAADGLGLAPGIYEIECRRGNDLRSAEVEIVAGEAITQRFAFGRPTGRRGRMTRMTPAMMAQAESPTMDPDLSLDRDYD